MLKLLKSTINISIFDNIKSSFTNAFKKNKYKSAAVAENEMDDRLATIVVGRKEGGAVVPLSGRGKLGPHITQCRLGKWHLDP